MVFSHRSPSVASPLWRTCPELAPWPYDGATTLWGFHNKALRVFRTIVHKPSLAQSEFQLTMSSSYPPRIQVFRDGIIRILPRVSTSGDISTPMRNSFRLMRWMISRGVGTSPPQSPCRNSRRPYTAFVPTGCLPKAALCSGSRDAGFAIFAHTGRTSRRSRSGRSPRIRGNALPCSLTRVPCG